MKAKYLTITEFSAEDYDKVIDRDMINQANRAVHPEKYPKYATKTSWLVGELPKLTQTHVSIDVYEVDDPEQIANNLAFWNAFRRDAKSFKRYYIPLVEYGEPYVPEFEHARKQLDERKEQLKTTQ